MAQKIINGTQGQLWHNLSLMAQKLPIMAQTFDILAQHFSTGKQFPYSGRTLRQMHRSCP